MLIFNEMMMRPALY